MTLCDATQLCSDAFREYLLPLLLFWHGTGFRPHTDHSKMGAFRFPYSQAQISHSLEEVDVGEFLHLIHISLCFDHFLVVE